MGKLSNGWTDWHRIWYTSVDSSGNRLKRIHPTITQGGILGGFMGSTIQNTVKCGQTAGPIVSKCDPTPQNEALLEKLRSALRAEM